MSQTTSHPFLMTLMSCRCSEQANREWEEKETGSTELCIQRNYSNWLCPKRAFGIHGVKKMEQDHPLFQALLGVCEKKDELYYVTSLYPVYLMIRQYVISYEWIKDVIIEYRWDKGEQHPEK